MGRTSIPLWIICLESESSDERVSDGGSRRCCGSADPLHTPDLSCALPPCRRSHAMLPADAIAEITADSFWQLQCATLGPTAMWEPIMANIEQHRAVLQELNRNFVRSVDEANVAWFDANLAADFLNTTPDGSLIDRKAFLAQIGRGSTDKNIREHDVMIRILGDFAIIHARTTYMNPDGTQGSGRYTDDYQFRDGRWQCVSAHYTRA